MRLSCHTKSWEICVIRVDGGPVAGSTEDPRVEVIPRCLRIVTFRESSVPAKACLHLDIDLSVSEWTRFWYHYAASVRRAVCSTRYLRCGTESSPALQAGHTLPDAFANDLKVHSPAQLVLVQLMVPVRRPAWKFRRLSLDLPHSSRRTKRHVLEPMDRAGFDFPWVGSRRCEVFACPVSTG